MGLAGGIVRRVFSRSPCSSSSASAGAARGHSERSSVDHKSRWGSLRMYLCGDEISAAAAEEEDDETVSVGSFETCAMPPPQETQALTPAQVGDVGGADNSPDEPQHQESIPENEKYGALTEPVTGVDDAATSIQSAFRGFMARRKLQELKRCSEKDRAGEPRSPTSASIAASVEVQVGESLSNVRLSEEEESLSASAQHRASQRSRPQVFRVKEEWDDSTVSSNVSRMRMQSRMEATTRRQRALAYAFSQQLRSCGGTRKRSARPEQGEFNVGWSWLERWMATRQAEPAADDCLSKNADSGSAAAGARRVIIVRRRHDLAGEEKESCGSNDVSAVSFDGSSSGGRNGLSCYKPGKNRLRGGRNLHPRRKSSSDHRLQARSQKVSKKVHQREQAEAEAEQRKDQTEAEAYDAYQPPTDY